MLLGRSKLAALFSWKIREGSGVKKEGYSDMVGRYVTRATGEKGRSGIVFPLQMMYCPSRKDGGQHYSTKPTPASFPISMRYSYINSTSGSGGRNQ